jgi:hypothetical protein
MSFLIPCTIFISFCKSFSFWFGSCGSSIYNKWLIFLSVPCTWYPQSALFSSFVNGMTAIQKSTGERESCWNIPLHIWNYYHHHTHYFLYAGYLYIYSWDKPCP